MPVLDLEGRKPGLKLILTELRLERFVVLKLEFPVEKIEKRGELIFFFLFPAIRGVKNSGKKCKLHH